MVEVEKTKPGAAEGRLDPIAQLLRRRANSLAEFAEWESHQPAAEPPPDLFARIGALWELLPEQDRRRPVDPDCAGIAHMHRQLAVLGERR